jgi:hypothetical protein
MATIQFFGSDGSFPIQNLNGSGVGFYGSTFGTSVAVGSYQDTSWITDANGTVQGPQITNVKWTHPSSGSINGAASKALVDIPNHLATLKIRFNHSTAIKTQNEKLRIYDRASIDNPASGVTCKVAEIAHPSTTQTGSLGSGDSSWKTPTGSSVVVSLGFSSPGLSGLRPNGTSTTDLNHDFHFALSASPDSIGSKTQFALYFQLEYL